MGIPAVKIIEDKKTGRRAIQVHYSALGPEVEERIHQRAARKYSAGIHDPIFQADYELSLTAQPGELIFKSFDDKNVASIEFNPGKHPQILSFDFGFEHPTCCLAGQQTPKQLHIYYEHYLAGVSARIHKARIRKGLMNLRPFAMWNLGVGAASESEAVERARRGGFYAVDQKPQYTPASNIFDQFTAIGDVSGSGYIAEYAEEPFPVHIGQPSQAKGWRDKDAMESVLDGLFRNLKRCCWYVWPDEVEHCPKCKKPLESIPGVLIDPGCLKLRLEIPAQVTDENGKRKKNIADHAVDALLYMSRYAMDFRLIGREKKKPPAPYYMRQPTPEDGADDEDREMYGDNSAVVDFFR